MEENYYNGGIMRIIKHGSFYELGRKTCPKCGCEFAYNKNDIKEEYDKDDECYIDILYCPECKNRMRV